MTQEETKTKSIDMTQEEPEIDTIDMAQEEARIKLIELTKETAKVNGRKLLILNSTALVLLAAAIIFTINKDVGLGVAFISGIVGFYMLFVRKFYPNYDIAKRALKRLEAGFEKDFDYIGVYQTGDTSTRK